MNKRLLTLDEFIVKEKEKQVKESSDEKPSYGCLMVAVNNEGWDDFVKSFVNEEDLYTKEGYGIETEPHVTVMYGFHDNADIEKIKEFMCPLTDLTVSSKNIDLFENKDFDVLKYNIDSEKLHELNKLMTENFEYTTDYPDYHPHITIAYLKPGSGKKYVKELTEGKTFEPIKYFYSFPDDRKEYFTK